MIQLILHLIGDYVTQSDWMAQNKRNAYFPAFVHALVYSLPFLLLTTHIPALACIFGTHFLIDRFGLARYIVWLKNFSWWKTQMLQTDQMVMGEATALGEFATDENWLEQRRKVVRIPFTWTWAERSATGYPPERPAWLAVWLLIACDNTLHLAINYAALRWL